MFANFFQKVSTFADHHQVLIAGAVAFSIICLTWGIEKILETYLFPKRPKQGYFIAIIFGLTLLWITNHYMLKAF